MALETQLIEVPFTGGLDLKADEKLVVPGKLVSLENGVFTKRGKIRKRLGYMDLSRDIEGGSALTAGEALGVYDSFSSDEPELLLFDRRTAYGFSRNIGRWTNKGRTVPCTVSNREILRNSAEQSNVDSATASGVTVFAWTDSQGGNRVTAIDQTSGSVLLAETELNSGGGAPRTIAIGSSIHVVYPANSDTEVRIRTINIAGTVALGSEGTLASTLDSAAPFIDVFKHGLKSVLVWASTAGGIELAYLLGTGLLAGVLDGLPAPIVIKHPTDTFVPGDVTPATDIINLPAHLLTENTVVRFTSTSTLPAGLLTATDFFVLVQDTNNIKVSATLGGGPVDITDGGTGTHTIAPQEDADNCVAVTVDQTIGDIYVGWHSDLNGLRVTVLRNDFTYLVLPLTMDGVVTKTVNLTAVVVSAGATTQWYWEVIATQTVNHFLKEATLTSAGVVAGVAVFKRGLGLAGKAFVQDSIVHVTAVHDSTLQATFFTLDEDGNTVAKMLPLVAGGLRLAGTIAAVTAGSASIYTMALAKKTRFVSEPDAENQDTSFTLRGVSEGTLDFASARRYLSVQLGRNLHTTGGFLAAYDGQGYVEHGFFIFPEDVTVVPAASGGSMADGTYQYSVIYEWTDNAGQIHRSVPSVGVTAVVSGGGGSGQVTVTVPTLRLTAKTSPRSEVSIAIYRTGNNGTLFQRVTLISSPLYNDPTVDTLAFVDTIDDTDLSSRELLYTTGGILADDGPPSISFLAVGKNRIFAVSEEDPNNVWFSKEHVPGAGVGFSEFQKISVDPGGGPITALAVMDDKVIVFKAKRVYSFSGAGPDESGAGAAFSQVDDISVDVGCSDARAVSKSDNGLVFKTEKGRYRLTRSLSVEYFGADVESLNSLEDTSAVLLASVNQVRFTTTLGPTLMYDFEHGQWGTFTAQPAVDAILWGSAYVWLQSDGRVWEETEGHFRDGNVRYSTEMTTAWIKLAGLQGFQRVRRALVIGNANGEHILQIQVGYSYQSAFPESFSFDSRTIESSFWGSSSYWGADSVWGGVEDDVYQWEMHLGIQKSESIRFLFRDLPVTDEDEGFEIAGLALLAGFKKGAAKLRNEKRA